MRAETIGGGAERLVELAEQAEAAEGTTRRGRNRRAEAFGLLLAHGIATGNDPEGRGAFIEASAHQGPALGLAWIDGRLHVRNPNSVYRDPAETETRSRTTRPVEGEDPHIRISRCLETWSRTRPWNETNRLGLGIEGWTGILKAVAAAASRLSSGSETVRKIAASGRLWTPQAEETGTTIDLDNRNGRLVLWVRSTRKPVVPARTTPHGESRKVLELEWTEEDGFRPGPAEAAAIVAGRIATSGLIAGKAALPNTAGWEQLLRELAAHADVWTRKHEATEWLAVATETEQKDTPGPGPEPTSARRVARRRNASPTARQWRLTVVRIGKLYDADHGTDLWIEPGCRIGGAYLESSSSRALLIGAVAVTCRVRSEDVAHQRRQQYWPGNIGGTASHGRTTATALRIGTRKAVWGSRGWESESLKPVPGMRLATITYERAGKGMKTGFADPSTSETAAYPVETVAAMIRKAASALGWEDTAPGLTELLRTVAGWKNGKLTPAAASATHQDDRLEVEQLEVRKGSGTADKVDEYLRDRPATAPRR